MTNSVQVSPPGAPAVEHLWHYGTASDWPAEAESRKWHVTADSVGRDVDVNKLPGKFIHAVRLLNN